MIGAGLGGGIASELTLAADAVQRGASQHISVPQQDERERANKAREFESQQRIAELEDTIKRLSNQVKQKEPSTSPARPQQIDLSAFLQRGAAANMP